MKHCRTCGKLLRDHTSSDPCKRIYVRVDNTFTNRHRAGLLKGGRERKETRDEPQ